MEVLVANKTIAVSGSNGGAAGRRKREGAVEGHSRPQLSSLRYQSVCEEQQCAAVRNEALLQDVRRLKEQLSLAAAQTSRLETLKRQYEEYLAVVCPQWLAQVHRVSREQEQPPRHPPPSSSPLRVSSSSGGTLCVTTQSQVCLPTGVILTASGGNTVTSRDQTSVHQDGLLPLHASRPAVSSYPPATFPPQNNHTTLLMNGGPSHQPHPVIANAIGQSYQAEPLAVTTVPIMHTQVTFTAAQTSPLTFSTVISTVKERAFQATPPASALQWPRPPLHTTSQLKLSGIPVSEHHGPPLPALDHGRTLQSAVNVRPPLESTYTSSVALTETQSGRHSVDVLADIASSVVPRPDGVDVTLETSRHSTSTEQRLPSSYKPVDSTLGDEGSKLPVKSKPFQTKSAAVFSPGAIPDTPNGQVESSGLSDPHSAPASHDSAQEPSRPTSTDPAKLLEDLTLSSLSDSTHDSIHSPEEGILPTGALPTNRVSPEDGCSSPDASQVSMEAVEVEKGHATSNPPSEGDAASPPQDRQTSSPPQDRQTSSPPQDRQTSSPPQDRQTSSPPQDRQTSSPPQDRQTSSPLQDRQTSSPLQDRQTSSPPQDRQTSFPLQDRQTSSPLQDRQTSSPLQDRQTSSPPQVPQDDGSSSSSEGDSELDGETVVVNLLATLDAHLAEDQETSSLMYTAPQTTDDMKEHITGSTVLTSNLTRTAHVGEDVSSWDVGAVSVVLLQRLAHMSRKSGSLISTHMTEDSAPLYTSGDQLGSELSAGWAGVWPRLLEHMQLLHHCGREVDELAAIFTPALIVTDSPAKREKACLQLLTVLQFYMPPSDNSLLPPTPSDSQEPSVVGDGPLQEEAGAVHSQGTVSQHSSLLSEGSAIAEIEKELQAAMREEGKSPPARSDSSVPQAPLMRPSSPLGDHDDNGSSSLSSLSPFSPAYVPTAVEQRSQVSQSSNLKKRLGFWGYSDSEGSDLDLPAVTPLNNEDKDDFDFYG